MWYVVQVQTGSEESVMIQCRKIIKECDQEGAVIRKIFIPYYERKRRYNGAWHTERKIMFPGYVFIVSDNPEELVTKLRLIQGLTKVLKTGNEIVPISESEVKVLQRLGGDEQVVETSIGLIENDRIIITSGPLEGMEGYIKKIDRHKRIAWLEIELMGRNMQAQVGLEVVEKR